MNSIFLGHEVGGAHPSGTHDMNVTNVQLTSGPFYDETSTFEGAYHFASGATAEIPNLNFDSISSFTLLFHIYASDSESGFLPNLLNWENGLSQKTTLTFMKSNGLLSFDPDGRNAVSGTTSILSGWVYLGITFDYVKGLYTVLYYNH